MPGPCSAPNGKYVLVGRTPDADAKIDTGKTKLKRGEIVHARIVTAENRVRKAGKK